jgi:hypothetical protein
MQYFNIVNATGSPGSNQTQMELVHYKMNHANGAGYCRFSRMTTANAEVRVEVMEQEPLLNS